MSQRHTGAALLAFVSFTSCGYIGDPLPPSLEIPAAVKTLQVTQQGDRLIASYEQPSLTTEGLKLKPLEETEFRLGQPGTGTFNVDAWAPTAAKFEVPPAKAGAVEISIPAESYQGQTIAAAVRIKGAKGRYSNWSNVVVLPVATSLAKPAGLAGKAEAGGVRLRWQAVEGAEYRVFKDDKVIGETKTGEYLDANAEFGKAQSYRLQAFRKVSEKQISVSPVSELFKITPEDTFPPAAPQSLQTIAGVGAIELTWPRNTESDFKSYKVWRAEAGGDWKLLAADVTQPSYSDRTVQRGKPYRYAISAVDTKNNESEKSQAMELTLPK